MVVLLLAAGPASLAPPVVPIVAPVAAQREACGTSGPDTGAYTVRVCLYTPDDGDVVSGDVTVAATVEAEGAAAPAVKFAQFFFSRDDAEDSSAVLRDYGEPFTFTLPTDRWSDGPYRLELDVRFADQFTSERVGIGVTTANGVGRIPSSTGRWEPTNVAGDRPVVAAVGDAADGLPGSNAVAELIEGWTPQMLLYLGDVYNVGSYTEFVNYYAPTLGRLRDITNPVPGDHEGGRQFQGYLDYWDSTQQYYATTAGSWRLFGLNSTERFGQTSSGTAQFDWLESLLAADDDTGCTIVFMHTPRWGQSPTGDNEYLDELWRLFVAEGVDIVLAGHEHNYQRWTPMDAEGTPSLTGTTAFVVGTGGHELITYSERDPRLVGSVQGVYGALRLELGDGSARYQFVDTAGAVLDAGDIQCGGASSGTSASGTIATTNGLGTCAPVAADNDAEVVTVLPDGTRVALTGGDGINDLVSTSLVHTVVGASPDRCGVLVRGRSRRNHAA